VDTSRLVFASSNGGGSDVTALKERRFLYTNTPPEGEQIAFETFSSRPAYANTLGPRDGSGHHPGTGAGAGAGYRDVHTLGHTRPTDRRVVAGSGAGGGGGGGVYGEAAGRRQHHTQPRSFSPSYGNVRETSFGGKRVTFKNDLAARSAGGGVGGVGGGGGPESAVSLSTFRDISGVSGGVGDRPPGFFPSLQRVLHEDDDNTTTSGSYTLNVEDDIDDLPPPLAQSLA
jgi:hypothetical protein